MKSYACIDRIEGEYAVCEVELVSVEDSPNLSCLEKETIMVDVPNADILQTVYNAHESDILVVEHDDGNVIAIYGKDDEEKQRRIDFISSLMSNN